jgi:hypothetical protein
MKRNLADAYGAKRAMMAKGGMCSKCRPGMKCMAHGGEVDELREAHAEVSMAPDEMVDQDVMGQEESSMEERDLPQASESLSLSQQVMRDRKRRMMAKGGMVEADEADEMEAPMEDGRESRGLNAEPVHTMEDDEHDESDASLVAQIVRERRKRRMDD